MFGVFNTVSMKLNAGGKAEIDKKKEEVHHWQLVMSNC